MEGPHGTRNAHPGRSRAPSSEGRWQMFPFLKGGWVLSGATLMTHGVAQGKSFHSCLPAGSPGIPPPGSSIGSKGGSQSLTLQLWCVRSSSHPFLHQMTTVMTPAPGLPCQASLHILQLLPLDLWRDEDADLYKALHPQTFSVRWPHCSRRGSTSNIHDDSRTAVLFQTLA